VQHRNLRREFVTLDELEENLREHGVVNIADVRAAFMESDGKFSVIPYKGNERKDAQAKPPDGAPGVTK